MSGRPIIDKRDIADMATILGSVTMSVVRVLVLMVAIMALAWSAGSLVGIAVYALRVINGWT